MKETASVAKRTGRTSKRPSLASSSFSISEGVSEQQCIKTGEGRAHIAILLGKQVPSPNTLRSLRTMLALMLYGTRRHHSHIAEGWTMQGQLYTL